MQLTDGHLIKDSKRSKTQLHVTDRFGFKVDEFLIRLKGLELLHQELMRVPNFRIEWQVQPIFPY